MLPKPVKVCIFLGCVLWLLLFVFNLLRNKGSSITSKATVEHGQHLLKNDRFYNDVINVCMSTDKDRLMGLVTTMNSIYKNSKYPVKFHIVIPRSAHEQLTTWISHTELETINYEVTFFDVDKVRTMIRVHDGRQELSNPMNYARFYYPQLFPQLKGRAIHVDDDCIVQGDIFELNRVKLTANQTIAFSNDCKTMAKRTAGIDTMYFKYINLSSDRVKSLGLDPRECSFNTGVYVFDVDKWRKRNITSQLEYWMNLNTRENIYGNRDSGGGSQPPMMLAFYRQYTVLNPLWNLRHLGTPAARKYPSETIRNAKLLHWSGPFKPWHGQSAWTELWDKYYVPDPEKNHRPVRKYGGDSGTAA